MYFCISVGGADAFEQTPGGTFKRIASTSSVMSSIISGYGNVYSNVWKAFLYLANDASSSVAELAKRLITHVKHKVRMKLLNYSVSCESMLNCIICPILSD